MQKLCSTTKNIVSSLLRSRFCQTFLCIWKMRCSSTDQHSCSFSDHKYFPKQAPIKLSTYYGTTRKEKWFKDQKGVTAWFWYSFKLYSYPSAAWSWRQPGNFKSSSPFILSIYVSLSQAVQYTLFFFFWTHSIIYIVNTSENEKIAPADTGAGPCTAGCNLIPAPGVSRELAFSLYLYHPLCLFLINV